MTTLAPTGTIIEANVVYGLDEFKRRTGMGHAAMREARRKGLLVRRVGLRSFVLGADFLRFVETHGKPVA